MIKLSYTGDWDKTASFLKRASKMNIHHILQKYGEKGVEALKANTPKLTGVTSESWSYEIVKQNKGYTIRWNNSNIQNGVLIALIIQYGHGTRNGGYVQGIDYINPSLQPIFEQLANDAWKEVTNS